MDQARISVLDGELAGSQWPLPTNDGARFTIGRRSNCDLVLRVDTISREHCVIEHRGGDYFMVDNGSANRSLLNGVPVDKGRLVHGDVITLDRITLEFLSSGRGPRPDDVDRELVLSKRDGAEYSEENSLIGRTIDGEFQVRTEHGPPGPYKLLAVVGEGGMAVVYKARSEADGSLVALKMLKGGSGRKLDPENLARLRKEARTGALLNHPNIMQTYGLFEYNGVPCLVVEYISGSTLQEILHEKGRLSQKATLKIGIQVCRALEYALEHNVIHRDIKPENIMISQVGEVKVTDLGLAKEITPYLSMNLTKTGEGIGTLHYMPPEQVENTKGVDHRADIYALGATLYECFCGEPPFDEPGVWKFVEAINNKQPPALIGRVRGLHPAIWPLIERCLAKKPAGRPGTHAQFRREMEDILGAIREGEQQGEQ